MVGALWARADRSREPRGPGWPGCRLLFCKCPEMPSFSIGYVSRKYLRAKYKAERLAYMKEQRCVQTQKSKDEKNKKRRTGVIMDEREKSMIQGMVCV